MSKSPAAARQAVDHLSEKLETLKTMFATHVAAPGPNGTVTISMRSPEYQQLLKALDAPEAVQRLL